MASIASSKSSKKEKVQCSGCKDDLEVRHAGLSCPQGHHLCLAVCAKNYANMILGDPVNNLPPRCPDCRAEYNIIMMERVLTPEQLEHFNDRMFEIVFAKKCCASDEVLCQCPFCNYSEYRQIANNEKPMFVFCQRPGCLKRSCATCKLEVSDLSLDGDNEGEDGDENTESDEEQNSVGLMYHMMCAQLAEIKERFDNVMSISIGLPCPQCGIVGRKDDACNHMCCGNCGTDWCYMCGKKQADLESDQSEFYSHFDGWQTNMNRCPMYLYQIADIDSSWPVDADGDEVVNFFHKQLTLRALNRFYTDVGKDNWYKLSKHFASVQNCGFEPGEFLSVPCGNPMFVRT